MKLLVVGSVAFDAIETPFGKTDKILGGAATYIGIAANNKIPNTNPAKPCKCACVSCHQRKREKMSKLNMNFIIVHVTKK